MLQPMGSQRWTRLNSRRTSTRRGVLGLGWPEAGPVLRGPRAPPPSQGWRSHSHLTDRETEAPEPAQGRELREGAHTQTKVSLGRSCFLSTELAASVHQACAHCLSGGRYIRPTMPRCRVSSRKAPHLGQTPSSPHLGKAARMPQAAGTSALQLRGWTPLISGNNSSEAERGSETPRTWAPPSCPCPQQASSTHSWSLAVHLQAGQCLTPWQWRGGF